MEDLSFVLRTLMKCNGEAEDCKSNEKGWCWMCALVFECSGMDGVTNAKFVLSQCYNASVVKEKHLKVEGHILSRRARAQEQEKETCGISIHKFVGMGKDSVMAVFPEDATDKR